MATTPSWVASTRVDRHTPALRIHHAASGRACVAVVASSPQGPRVVLVDEEDHGLPVGSLYINAGGYPCTTGNEYLHHKVMFAKRVGEPMPPGMSIDHINWTKTDNRCENLRVATQGDQQRNRGDLADRKPPHADLLELGIKRLPRFMSFDDTSEMKYMVDLPSGQRISGTKSAKVSHVNKFRDALEKMIATFNISAEDKAFYELRIRLAQEHNDIVAAAHAAQPDVFPDGPYTDVDVMCDELTYCHAVLARLPPVEEGEVLFGPRKVGKLILPSGTPGLPPNSMGIIKGDSLIIFDSEFSALVERLPEIDVSSGAPYFPVTQPLKALFPELAKASARKINLKDVVWRFMLGRGPVPDSHTLVPINYQQADVRAENLCLLPGTGKEHKSRVGIPRVPDGTADAVGMRFMPRNTSFMMERGRYIMYTRGADGKTVTVRCAADAFETTFTNELLPLLRNMSPTFDADNVIFQRMLGEYVDAYSAIMGRQL